MSGNSWHTGLNGDNLELFEGRLTQREKLERRASEGPALPPQKAPPGMFDEAVTNQPDIFDK